MFRTFPSFLLYIVIFLTGSAGLIYQVTWQKYLSRILGSDTFATAIILATFLGGLSLGYFVCGKRSTLTTNNLKSYALLEGVIGVWCLSFSHIFALVENMTRDWSFTPPFGIVFQGVFCSIILMAVPTICMGGTLPFLTRGISRTVADASRIHARIYAVNTAGAFLGALAAGFFLIPRFGLPGTMERTALFNVAALFIVLFLSRFFEQTGTVEKRGDVQPGKQVIEEKTSIFPAWILYLVGFLSGFYVMTLENVLIRVVNFSIGGSSYSFSLIVAVFVLSIAVGSYMVSHFKRFGDSLLFLNQLFITLSLFLLYLSLDSWPYWTHVIRVLFQSNSPGFWAYYSFLFLFFGAVLFLPICLMGATLPIAFHELKRDIHTVGKHSGYLFSFNTIGSLAGSLIGGILFFYFLNLSEVFLTTVLLAAFSMSVTAWLFRKVLFGVSVVMVFLIGVCLFQDPFFDKTHFSLSPFYNRTPLPYSFEGAEGFFENFNKRRGLVFYNDGPAATVSVTEKYSSRAIVVNGKPDSSTLGDIYTLKLSAHIPALLGHSRTKVMVIGMGTGVTAGEFTLYDDIEDIDIAEISPSVIQALPHFKKYTYDVGADPRVKIHTGDAFRILSRSKKKWDIIVSEPSNPWVTGVDLLFSQEFYQLVNKRLTSEGVLLQWLQTYDTSPEIFGRVLNTLEQEFSEVRIFFSTAGDALILASNLGVGPGNIRNAEQTFSRNRKVRDSLGVINLGSLDSLLIRELWANPGRRGTFASFKIEKMDTPGIHYLGGKRFFDGKYLPRDFLFGIGTALNYRNFLLVKRYPDWENGWPFPENSTESLIQSTTDKVTGEVSPMFHSLKTKYYLSRFSQGGMQVPGVSQVGIDVTPFISAPVLNEERWRRIGLFNATYKKKAKRLLEITYKNRNWIVPLPVAGLLKVLNDCILNGKDAYERNWCTLQLANFKMKENRGKSVVNMVLESVNLDNSGKVIARLEDEAEMVSLFRTLREYTLVK
ncbi:MAG: fused MFS/spermidine synthase [Nitrospinota bacterium]